MPDAWPVERFDLIVLSEIIYYLTAVDVARLVECARRTLQPDGDILLVNWTGTTTCPMSGDAAAQAFIKGAAPFSRLVRQEREAGFRIDLLTRFSHASLLNESEFVTR